MAARPASPFLDLPLRIEAEARAAREQADQERRHRLEHHSAGFCRTILDGTFGRGHHGT